MYYLCIQKWTQNLVFLFATGCVRIRDVLIYNLYVLIYIYIIMITREYALADLACEHKNKLN